MKKRILSLLLAIITVAALAFPSAGSVMAASYKTFKYEAYDSEVGGKVAGSCTWKYESKEKTLYFSKGMVPNPYSCTDCPWIQYMSEAKKISIGKGVTKMIDAFVYAGEKGGAVLTDFVVSADNAKYAAKDGVLYNKKMTEIIAFPAEWGRTTYTIPKNLKLTDETWWMIPTTELKAYKVESGHKTLVAKDGVVYDKKMTKIIQYPSKKTSTTYTVPKTVRILPQGQDEVYFPAVLKAFKVEKGNPYHTAKDGVLYNKKMTEIVRYPYGKTDVAIELPKTVKNLDPNTISGNFTCVVYTKQDQEFYNSYYQSVKMISLPHVENRAPSELSNLRVQPAGWRGIEFSWDVSDNEADGYVLYRYNTKTKKYEKCKASNSLQPSSMTYSDIPTAKTKFGLKSFTVQKDGSIKYGTMVTCTYTPEK